MTRVEVLPDALRQIERASSWWRKHRLRAPELFSHELAAAFKVLEEQPESGRMFPRPRFPELRVLLMPRTRYHLYYDIVGEDVRVLSVWSAVRGRGQL